MKKLNFILLFLFTILILLLDRLFLSYSTDNNIKKYIINNISEVKYVDTNSYTIKGEGYYEELTIMLYSDSSYSIVCWGNRESFLWDILKDKEINSSIEYDRHKGVDVSTDVELIKKLHTEKIKYIN